MIIRNAIVTDINEIKKKFVYAKRFNVKTFDSDYIYVAEDCGNVIAYLYGDMTKSSRTAILFGIEVLQEYRNKNIATNLIKCFEDNLKKDNCDSILVFYNKNDNLGKFYNKIGFEIGDNLAVALKDIG